ncbi:Cytoplasmic dynein 1 heavy chain 1 [Eumeta japonica]|uniref:Cytoplasmic dynein 1 heavy chain 1 n=1 Tax=Eumeta variegata TaxID=151549 RepID=A0A4C2ABZ9_EUMVA|nr:Cytoplasmic dynein 1 heavy chain 1 [Eumeta japonica]
MATELNKPLSSIAIGSAEGFNRRTRYQYGLQNWQMGNVENVHLAPVWLVQLEKKLHSLQPHPNFRLFLTTEIHLNFQNRSGATALCPLGWAKFYEFNESDLRVACDNFDTWTMLPPWAELTCRRKGASASDAAIPVHLRWQD